MAGEITAIQVSPDRKFITSAVSVETTVGESSQVLLWNRETLQHRFTFPIAAARIHALAFDRSSQVLAVSDDRGVLTTLNVGARYQLSESKPQSRPLKQVLFLRDDYIITASDRVQVWNDREPKAPVKRGFSRHSPVLNLRTHGFSMLRECFGNTV